MLGLPNVTLLVEAEVTRLETDASGRSVTNVVVTRGGTEEQYRADVVVVSAGAANSAKLLLRSANDQHPNGLANGSDQVGRNYMFHNSKAVVALSKELNETVFQKTLAINDFYFGADGYDWPVGNIQMVGKSNAAAMKGEEPKLTMLAPHWTSLTPPSMRSTSGSPLRTSRHRRTASPSTPTPTSASRTTRPTTTKPTASTTSSSRS